LRKFLRGWAINIKSAQRRQKEESTNELKNLDALGDAGLLEEEDWQRRYKLEADMMQIYAAEEEYWQRRGGEQWLLKGDSNTAFFHSVANGRRRKTAIMSLVDKDDLIKDNEQLKRHINDYYKNLFGKEPVSPMGLKEDTWATEGRISADDCIKLVKPFSMEEIENAIKHTKTNTAPDSDGFPVQFYKTFWPKVRELVKEMLDDMAAGRFNLGRLNYGVIILIPKIKDANTIRQYRSICLLNVIFKIITKVLTNRLTLVADKVIHSAQTAFIPGRNIYEGVVVLEEVIHELHKTKAKGIILKLDFEKAYDKVQWAFLKEVMRLKGFCETWIKWITLAVETGKVCINLNGVNGEFFQTFRGLRQGDPLSPILFNLVGEALGAMINAAKSKRHLSGLVTHLVDGGITHLQYTDDTVLFLNLDDKSIATMKFLLYCYETMSGLKINYQKSEVFTFGVEKEEQQRVADLFNCKVGSLPMKYLGILVADRKLLASDFEFLPIKIKRD
jgi:hypothetical protein